MKKSKAISEEESERNRLLELESRARIKEELLRISSGKYQFIKDNIELYQLMLVQFKSTYGIGMIIDKSNSPHKLISARKSLGLLKEVLLHDVNDIESIKFVFKNTRSKSIIIDSGFIISKALKAIESNKEFQEFLSGYELFLQEKEAYTTGRLKKEANKAMMWFSESMNQRFQSWPEFKTENQRFKLIADLINIIRYEYGQKDIDYTQIRIWIKPTKKQSKSQ